MAMKAYMLANIYMPLLCIYTTHSRRTQGPQWLAGPIMCSVCGKLKCYETLGIRVLRGNQKLEHYMTSHMHDIPHLNGTMKKIIL